VLNVKLPHLNKWSQKRRDNASLYKKLFIEAGLAETDGKIKFDAKNKVLLPKAIYSDDKSLLNSHIYNQFIVRVEKRDEMRKFLSDNQIANEIYYPIPFHLQECFASLGYKQGDFPVSEHASATSIALPVFPELTSEQITFVVSKFREFIKG
jgi:dTDP-4-amino-4,6-dideoxygalactose transaminase